MSDSVVRTGDNTASVNNNDGIQFGTTGFFSVPVQINNNNAGRQGHSEPADTVSRDCKSPSSNSHIQRSKQDIRQDVHEQQASSKEWGRGSRKENGDKGRSNPVHPRDSRRTTDKRSRDGKGKSSHSAKEKSSQAARTGDNARKLTCFNCQRDGHKANTCTEPRSNNSQKKEFRYKSDSGVEAAFKDQLADLSAQLLAIKDVEREKDEDQDPAPPVSQICDRDPTTDVIKYMDRKLTEDQKLQLIAEKEATSHQHFINVPLLNSYSAPITGESLHFEDCTYPMSTQSLADVAETVGHIGLTRTLRENLPDRHYFTTAATSGCLIGGLMSFAVPIVSSFVGSIAGCFLGPVLPIAALAATNIYLRSKDVRYSRSYSIVDEPLEDRYALPQAVDVRPLAHKLSEIDIPKPIIKKVYFKDFKISQVSRDLSVKKLARNVAFETCAGRAYQPHNECLCQQARVDCICTMIYTTEIEELQGSNHNGSLLVSISHLNQVLMNKPPERERSFDDTRKECKIYILRIQGINLSHYAAYDKILANTIELAAVIIHSQEYELRRVFNSAQQSFSS